MKLEEYSTEELKAELKRRWKLKKEEKNKVPRCRTCVHRRQHPNGWNIWLCSARTWGKKIVRNYVISLSNKACDLYEKEPSK